MNKDLYAVLGVERTADDKKLKSAYRKLAKKYHPEGGTCYGFIAKEYTERI